MEGLGKSAYYSQEHSTLAYHYYQTSRVREGSIIIDPNWRMLEEVDFIRLNKLRLEVEPAETLCVGSICSDSIEALTSYLESLMDVFTPMTGRMIVSRLRASVHCRYPKKLVSTQAPQMILLFKRYDILENVP